MIITLKFAELHSPLFLNGANLNLKLDIKNKPGLQLAYDTVEKVLFVKYNGVIGILPSSSVNSCTPMDSSLFQNIFDDNIEMPKPNVVSNVSTKIVAQVSTPMDHVFADEKKKPAPKPKFQGL